MKVLKTLKQLMPTATQGHVVTLAMMVAGIVLGKKAQLSAMSEEIPAEAKDKSIEKRMPRFVRNPRIGEEIYFMPFAELILSSLSSAPLVVAMDGSAVGRGCMVLMVGVMYHQRCLPLAWVVYKGKKGHTTAERHIAVLEQVLPFVPREAEVVLLGDGEYDNVEMLQWLQMNTQWDFVVRTPCNSRITLGTHQQSLSDVGVTKGSCITLNQAKFTAKAFAPITAVAWWDKAYDEPIYLISSLDDSRELCRFYKKRFKLETLFSDQKSRGFHIHKSHIAEPERLSRLLIAACLAYIWMIYLGMYVLHYGFRTLIDQPHRQDKSIFRLGMDWLKYCLKRGKPFPVCFFLFDMDCLLSLHPKSNIFSVQ
jgi:hypothetical protein